MREALLGCAVSERLRGPHHPVRVVECFISENFDAACACPASPLVLFELLAILEKMVLLFEATRIVA